MIPQMMATHWAISGDADYFTEKNMPTALMPGLLFLLLISMMLWLTRNTVQSNINTVTGANYLISLFISLLSAITAYSVVNGEAFPVVIARHVPLNDKVTAVQPVPPCEDQEEFPSIEKLNPPTPGLEVLRSLTKEDPAIVSAAL